MYYPHELIKVLLDTVCETNTLIRRVGNEYRLYFKVNTGNEFDFNCNRYKAWNLQVTKVETETNINIESNNTNIATVDTQYLEQLLHCLAQLCNGRRLLDIKYEQVRRQEEQLKEQFKLKERLIELEKALKGNKGLIRHFLRYLGVDVWDVHGNEYLAIESFFNDSEFEFDEMRLYPDTLTCFDLTTEKYYRFVYLMYAKFGDKIFDVPLDVDVDIDIDIDIDADADNRQFSQKQKHKQRTRRQMSHDEILSNVFNIFDIFGTFDTLDTYEHIFDFYWNNWNCFDEIDERNIKHKDWKRIYQIVRTLKTYPEIFTDDLVEQYKKQIVEGKISSVRRSISKIVDKWHLENWDKLDTETKTKIAVTYLYFRKYALKCLRYKNFITVDEIKRIERKIGNVSTHVKSSILKSLGLKRNKNKRKWMFIDSKMRKRVDGWLSEITQILENIEGS